MNVMSKYEEHVFKDKITLRVRVVVLSAYVRLITDFLDL